MEETNAPKLQTVMVVMIAVPFLFMALRFFSKAKYGRSFALDDWVLLFSWVRPRRKDLGRLYRPVC